MKILQLCHKPPKPTIDGGCIAMNNITDGLLRAGHHVKILTISTQKHPFLPKQLDKAYKERTQIESTYIDTRVNLIDAFSNLVTSDSYNVSRFFSTDFDILITKLLRKEKFDIIHLESLFMTPYIHTLRRLSKAKIVLRSHNLEYMIWERMADGTSNPAKRIYLNILAKQLKKYEENILQSIDGIVAISSGDTKKYQTMGCSKPLICLPFGINISNYTPEDILLPGKTRLFHIGSMDWKPNIEGISWFLEKIWPELTAQLPSLELHLAGRNMPDWLDGLKQPGVFIHPEVEDAKKFMNAYDIMIVPILSAGGMRVKIIEGMAMKKCVISTRIGAEGIDYIDKETIFIADKLKDFQRIIKKLDAEKKLIKAMGEKARKFVSARYDNDILTNQLIAFYKSL